MSTGLAVRPQPPPLPEAVEAALLDGDLGKLTVEHRLAFYQARCAAAGLNPQARPFAYVKMTGGKTVLYALKECAEQLNAMHKISHSVTSIRDDPKSGVIEVMCQATMGNGRTTFELGAVSIDGLRGEALCNAKMKAITKAKRRATLSLCGLGDMMDESELDTVQTIPCTPTGTPIPVDNGTGHGSGKYATDTQAGEYKMAIQGYLDKRNREWLDRNTGPDGVIAEGIKDVCNIWQADGHLAKWCEANGMLVRGSVPENGTKNNQICRLVAIPWFRSEKEQNAIKRELKRYLDDIERQQLERIELAKPVATEATDADPNLASDEWEEGRD